jgi:hypothetical protein
MQKIRSTSSAGKVLERICCFTAFDRTKPLVMIGDNVIITKIAIEFFRNKIRRAGFAGFDTVYNEIKMVGKRFNFRLVRVSKQSSTVSG